MQDSMFPELEPKLPPWNGVPEIVTSGWVKTGGNCGHCFRFLHKDLAIHKLAPACCEEHRRPQKRAKNGPGVWVCETCKRLLT